MKIFLHDNNENITNINHIYCKKYTIEQIKGKIIKNIKRKSLFITHKFQFIIYKL